ncbi:HpcH/HpaI aldolase family protein [Williamsia maris]|uniref:4-hydroxy-2-oxoheptanedioate aldolase n=1 Tax=Williamsia maris TaxID=72806 RepID=A0ABT1HB71_9NOCA|nr:aldolase/citrate lyase family protein [Williamsia maris]MCP2174941.1 4-hydroxy-2-oxoheptanedioate aldolase [Williamsia maris]
MDAITFARRIRNREDSIGYWVTLDAPPATERIARLGYDFVCLDEQHGMMGYAGILNGILAIDAGRSAVGMVRVGENSERLIERALDAGAVGVIVPMINTPEQAAHAVAATRYAPQGVRSYGPARSALRIGPRPADANDSTLVIAMIETLEAVRNIESICAVDGLDGVYVGPSDLSIALGGAFPYDPSVDDEYEQALRSVADAARTAGVAAGIHAPDGLTAAHRMSRGYTFACIANDLTHLEISAATHLHAAQARQSVDQLR